MTRPDREKVDRIIQLWDRFEADALERDALETIALLLVPEIKWLRAELALLDSKPTYSTAAVDALLEEIAAGYVESDHWGQLERAAAVVRASREPAL